MTVSFTFLHDTHLSVCIVWHMDVCISLDIRRSAIIRMRWSLQWEIWLIRIWRIHMRPDSFMWDFPRWYEIWRATSPSRCRTPVWCSGNAWNNQSMQAFLCLQACLYMYPYAPTLLFTRASISLPLWRIFSYTHTLFPIHTNPFFLYLSCSCLSLSLSLSLNLFLPVFLFSRSRSISHSL